MSKDKMEIVVHDRRFKIKASGKNPAELCALAEQLISGRQIRLANVAATPEAGSSPREAKRTFRSALKELFDKLLSAIMDRATAIVAWFIRLIR